MDGERSLEVHVSLAPLRYERWRRHGVNCTGISQAFGRTYVIRPADVGMRLRVRVTATNAEGSAASTSNASPIVLAAAAAGAPRNTAPPTISGTPQVGQSIAAGTWAGAQPLTYSYRWRRCDATGGSCAEISGATARTYTVTATDQGRTLRVRVTARNARGTASSTPLPLRSRQTFTARFHISDSRNHSVQGALVFVVATPFGTTTTPHEAATGADGWVTFQLTPTARVRFDRRGSITMFVRARKATDRLIGGVSTRRLVNLGIR